ncbi:DUF1453 domain-containing protein [Kitasatospora sp. NPDC051853]|uniref:DUF1453 domain-containing protein n=1 Tax=Kitasatospora sp. NPDC051853 TaxID=3364058 RepID=UPI0037ABEFE6
MNGWPVAVLVLAGVVVVAVRRVRGEPLDLRGLVAVPVVLTVLGLSSLLRAEGLTGTDYVLAVPGLLLGLGSGAVRGTTVRLSVRDGVLHQHYTVRTFAVLLLSAAAMAGYGLLATRLGLHHEARPTELGLGVSFLGESAVLVLRGLATGAPFARS